MTLTLNNLPSNAILLGHNCTFQVGQGNHSRTFNTESEEGKAVCKAATSSAQVLMACDYSKGQLSRLIRASSKRFGVMWEAILEESGKIRRNARSKAKVMAYRLVSAVVVLEVRQLVSLPLLTLPNGGAR